MEKTYIIGHKKPDTDSVTSAIALSYLKNKLGMNTEPRILGNLNKETAFVLKKANVTAPEFLLDVKVQIEDVPYDKNLMMEESSSIYEAYTYMVKNGITGMPVVDNNKNFKGYVSLKEIATDFIKGDFDLLKASYNNIIKVLDGKKVVQCDDDINGTIIAVTYSSESFISKFDLKDNYIMIVGKRKNLIDYGINNKVKMLILVDNQELDESEKINAMNNGVNVISTSKSAFEVSKLIGLSNYIKTILRNQKPVTFNPTDYLTDFFEISNKLKHTNYPIVDKDNKCVGLLRLLDVNKYNRKNVILVDHNDIKQSVDGLNEAVITEIIDHHAIGNLTTQAPIAFRNMIVGSTNTIVYKLYKEAAIDIPKDIALLMLAGILSDTLILKSPTTTDLDRETVLELSNIANLDYEKFGMDMLKAGSSLDGMSIEEIIFSDYKEFSANNMTFGIGQIISMDYEQVLNRKDEFIDELTKIVKAHGYKLACLFITDVVNNGSYVIYSDGANKIMSLAYNVDDLKQGTYLQDIISRKKQMVPNIMAELENMD